VLKEILAAGHYTLYASSEDLSDPTAVEMAVLHILQAYMDRFYRSQVQDLQAEATEPDRLKAEEVGLPQAYVVFAPKGSEVLGDLQQLKHDLAKWRTTASHPLPRLYIDPNILTLLYQPLVHAKLPEGVRTQPAPLVYSERQFVEELKEFWGHHRDDYPDVCLYLMRNPSRSGLGLHYRVGFFPDFVLWVERPSGWRVVFVEPHGMRHEHLEDNAKIEALTRLLPRLNARPDFRAARLELDGYIISTSQGHEIAGASAYAPDWDRLAREKRVLVPERGWYRNLKTILDNCDGG
jgi:hypothetical protein